MKIIETVNLSKKYNKFTALNNVSMSFESGDIYGLIGRNGAGKTTFFKVAMGLSPASSGVVKLNGEEHNLNAQRKNIGFMIGASSFGYLSASENIEYYRNLKGIKDKSETERVLKLVGLWGVNKNFKSFSMGMKQRLGIANALLGRPPVIILDEPINGLDPQGIADIRGMLKELHANGTSLIISSHILSELDLIANKFGFIEKGNFLQEISYEDLHKQTSRSLIIETSDLNKAQEIISPFAKEANCPIEIDNKTNRLILEGCLDISNKIAKTLIENNLELFELKKSETTLEEYFINLINKAEVE